jgi:ABC-type nitrate/sulfonate/bicarbonate transport system, permease component
MKVSIINRNWFGGLAIVVIIAGWQLAAILIHLPLILPTPAQAFRQAVLLLATVDFWHHLGATLARGLAGFGAALLCGLIIGIWAGKNNAVYAFFRPIIILLRSTPVMSVIILALIWFKHDTVPVFATFLMAFPLAVQNIIEGVRSIDHQLLEMILSYRVNYRLQLTRFYLPSLIPFLAAAISSGLGITWKVLIAAEVLAYPAWGIGTQMDTARVYLQTDKVFAWTLVVIALGLFFDYLLDYLLKRPFHYWKDTARGGSRP